MIGEQLGEQFISFSFRATKGLSVKSLKMALKGVLKTIGLGGHLGKSLLQSNQKGIKKLGANDTQLQGIEVSKSEIAGFNKYAKKYDLDFSIKHDKNDKSRYVLFIKAKDIDKLEHCAKEFINDKSLDNNSLVEKMDNAKEKAMNINKAKEKERTVNKSKGKSKGKER